MARSTVATVGTSAGGVSITDEGYDAVEVMNLDGAGVVSISTNEKVTATAEGDDMVILPAVAGHSVNVRVRDTAPRDGNIVLSMIASASCKVAVRGCAL